MKSSSDRHEGGVVGFGLVGDARVSEAGKRIEIESNEGIKMRLNCAVSRSGIVGDEKANLDRNLSRVGELPAIDLVVDLSRSSRTEFDPNKSKMDTGLGANGVELNKKQENHVEFTEKEIEYKVGDLVWGKVRSYPWWPAQIFDPSASTEKARKYCKKDCFLIVYFGDQTFAWNEPFNLKPFRTNFCKMAKQSNADAFCRAVEDALHEAGRRVEFGLLCSCSSQGDISSRIDGGDRLSTVDSFKPATVVQCARDLAKDPFGMSRLEVSTTKAQLLAFNRWKGYHQLHLNQILDGFDVDDNSEEKMVDIATPSEEVTKRGKLNRRGRKRKLNFEGGQSPSKKVKFLSDLMTNGSSSVSDGKSKTRKRGRKRKANGSREGIQSPSADEFLLQICLAARNPMEEVEQHSVDSLVKFLSDFRNYRVETMSQLGEDVRGSEATEVGGFTGIKDSYWTDRIIEVQPDEHVAKSMISDLSPKRNQENSATALILKFTSLDSIPPLADVNEIFRHYGAVQEEETKVLKKKNCVKVVFERRCDAETAFSSAGKFSIFGPALVSYCLNYSPTPRKTQSKKGVKSGEVAA